MIEVDCWVIHAAQAREAGPATLVRESIFLRDIGADEVLVEPIYGSWEANMTHALERQPIDICRRRSEQRAILGNSGVVRIVKAGKAVTHVAEGDFCLLAAIGRQDAAGYVLTVLGYDAPGMSGLLARQVKLRSHQVIPLPPKTRHPLTRWAPFPVRYGTAWDNWHVAYACWRTQMTEEQAPNPHVWAWGGGVGFAELTLAQRFGCRTAMIASTDERLQLIKAHGMTPIDRRELSGLCFDPRKFEVDHRYKTEYLAAERKFLNMVDQNTNHEKVSIFVENLGTPVQRATLRSLSRQGVLTTSGWKHGVDTTLNRAVECVERHILVHTHASRYSPAALSFAEETGWLPPAPQRVYSWEEIPTLASDYAGSRIGSYFPLYQVNPE